MAGPMKPALAPCSNSAPTTKAGLGFRARIKAAEAIIKSPVAAPCALPRQHIGQSAAWDQCERSGQPARCHCNTYVSLRPAQTRQIERHERAEAHLDVSGEKVHPVQGSPAPCRPSTLQGPLEAAVAIYGGA